MPELQLAFGLSFEQLHTREGLLALDAAFLRELEAADAPLHTQLLAVRAQGTGNSELLIALAPHTEDFIAQLFGVEKEVRELAQAHHALAPIFTCKRLFVQRRAAKQFSASEAAAFDGSTLEAALSSWFGEALTELSFARHVLAWLNNEASYLAQLDTALRYAAWALHSEAGHKKFARDVLFKQPRKLNPHHLIALEEKNGVLELPPSHRRERQGFALTDTGGTLEQAVSEAHYCIHCHAQERDSCSKGLHEKDGAVKHSALGVPLHGCPLEEKISEMLLLKSQGVALGALAMVCVDNPTCAGTGHRICNDCMKSCIYQKQEPVNIPLAETRTLSDILALPYGFEIYSLLTRWNPLNITRPLPLQETGKKVLVVGLGPAGYTLAHHLLNDGHTVVAIDGLKMEPLDIPFAPIHDITGLQEPLDTRVGKGFGGVAEYGITVRWDKNYLTVLRLLLERRTQFRAFGGVRFGGQLDYENTFALGFDHIALCLGAGKPTVLNIPNGMARGVRAASDFLMGLQLTGAARENSIANLQLRLPIVVIGGGLTAIDAATEALAYYPVQVEKFLARYEALGGELGALSEEETLIAEEFLTHARALRAAKAACQSIQKLLQEWGGAIIAYRKRLIDAPSYRLNHEEVEKALEEGVRFMENATPLAVHLDRFGHAKSLQLRINTHETTLPAKSILIAAGTSPNTVLAREDSAHFHLDGNYFQAVDEAGNPVSPERSPKPETAQVLLNIQPDGRTVSFLGDLHPSFAGNVVKAMASAKRAYPVISHMLAKCIGSGQTADNLFATLQEKLEARVHAVNTLAPGIIEVVVHAPLAAQRFEPGQFYRLQNFEAHAPVTSNQQPATTLAMEGLALTGAEVDRKAGLISLIVLEMGGSSDLCTHLKPGEPVSLMGPTGSPTHIPTNENVLLAGGGLGNAVLLSIGAAMRAAGCKVLYFAAYRRLADRYKIHSLEAAADIVVWCCEEAMITPSRPQDLAFRGNIVQAMAAYAEGKWDGATIPLSAINRILAIGSDRMMAAVHAARRGILASHLPASCISLASINSPMQCMMKEICAQCLQRHQDPVTGEEIYVFSCFNQDQSADAVDFAHLSARLTQNTLPEKLTGRWIHHCLKNPASARSG